MTDLAGDNLVYSTSVPLSARILYLAQSNLRQRASPGEVSGHPALNAA